MAKLWELARLIRSKNAGPFELTFDIMFADHETYERVCRSGAISADWVASACNLASGDVMVINYDAANAIKITIPRPVVSGHIDDTDVFGGQQYAPLVDLEIT
jgi:hypothetical protein